MAGTYGFWFARHRAERGDVHTWTGTPVPGRAGLHAATSPLAALQYANSDLLCRVSLHGTIRVVGDQMAATMRRVEYTLDAGRILRELARRWIERVLGQPIGDRARHLRDASTARARVVDLDERIRDARWALEEGARGRAPSDRAAAEGRLEGALRAAAEARRHADAHEAAAWLLERDDEHAIARAVERIVHAVAALDRADAAQALIDARAALDRELLDAIAPLVPAQPLPPFEPGPAPAAAAEAPPEDDEVEPSESPGLTPEQPWSWPEEGVEGGATLTEPSPPSTPEQPWSWPEEGAEGGATLTEPSPPSTSEGRPAGVPSFDEVLTAPPLDDPPLPSAADIVERLQQVLGADPAFISLHRIRSHRLTLLVRRARSTGAQELLETLAFDPVLGAANIGFVACADAAPLAGGTVARWFIAGSPYGFPISADDVLAARRSPPVDLARVDLLTLELIVGGVYFYDWLDDGGSRVLLLDIRDDDPRAVFARAARAGAPRALARVRRGGELRLVQSEGSGFEHRAQSELFVVLAPTARKSIDSRHVPLSPNDDELLSLLSTPRARLGAALASAPPHRAVYALDPHRVRTLRDAYVIVTDEAHVDALTVHLGRALSTCVRGSFFVVPEDPARTLHEGAAGVVSYEPWLDPPIDDYRFVDAVFEAMERPPIDLTVEIDDESPSPVPRAETTGIRKKRRREVDLGPLFESLAPVASAGFVTASLTGGRQVLAVWIVDAFGEARVRSALEESAPGLAFVLVTGASRLTPGLEPHVIAPNDAAKRALGEVDVLTLARALHHALAVDPVYRKRTTI